MCGHTECVCPEMKPEEVVWLVGAWEDSRGEWGGRDQGLNA